MDDLISRGAAMNMLSDVFGIPLDYDGECNEMCDEAFAAIEALPAVDAVPVVRCKSCMKRSTFQCPMYSEVDGSDYVLDIITNDRTDDDGYCHSGARMDGESEEDTNELL